VTAAEVDAYVGSNAGYYRHHWADALAGRPGDTGFNWAAFLFAGLWLPYRRLYGHALAMYALFEGVVLFAVLAEASQAFSYDAIMLMELGQFALALVAAVVIGACGNGWYLARFQRALAESRTQNRAGDVHLRALADRGGTDVVALFLFPIASAAVSVVVGAIALGAAGR
jgi:hypothetical protein